MPEKAGKLIGIGGLVVVSVLWVIAPFAVAQSTVPLEPLKVEQLQPLPAPAPEPEPIPVFEYGPKGLVAVPRARMSLKEQGLSPHDEATVVVRLQHLAPSTVLETLRSVFPSTQKGFSPDFQAGEVPGVPKVILRGLTSNVDHALRIVRAIDVPDPEDESEHLVQIFDLEHTDVSEVSQILASLLQRRTMTRGMRTTQFVVDQRTQKLIVEASSQKELEAVTLLIKELDVPVEVPELHTRVVPLRHIEAQYASSVIESLLGLSSGSGPRPSTRSVRIPTVRRGSFGPGRILVQEEANTLLIRATEDQFEEIEEILELIDIELEEPEKPVETLEPPVVAPAVKKEVLPVPVQKARPRVKAKVLPKESESSP